MRVLFVHQFLWAHYKAKHFSDLFAISQKTKEFEFYVIQMSRTEATRINIGAINEDYHQYKYSLLYDDYLENTPFWGKATKIFKIIRSFKADVVVLPGYFDPSTWPIYLYCKIAGIKTIMFIDSGETDNKKVWYKEIIKKIIVSITDGFLSIGPATDQYLLKLGAKKEQILMSRNALDNHEIRRQFELSQLNKEERKESLGLSKYNFIFVGRLIDFKNLFIMLEAFGKASKIHPEGENWGFLLVGDGPLETELRAFVVDKDIKNVSFLPPCEWIEVPWNLSLGDVLVLASYSEPWGFVVNEALICGKPVIVSNHCGCSSSLVKEGKNGNGYTFSPYNTNELADKMALMMSNNKKFDLMGKKGLEIIKDFSPEKVAAETVAAFKKVYSS
ncbi:MAG: glycosyltransferase family 4 protein [Bacteroidota bacterium]